MSYRGSSRVPNLRTIKAIRGESLKIDLGVSYNGTLTAWMKTDPNSPTYRSFEILDNRYLVLSKDKASDYLDGSGNVIEAIKGKWYFDVDLVEVGSTQADVKTVIRGTILFSNDITNSGGVERLDPITGLGYVTVSGAPQDIFSVKTFKKTSADILDSSEFFEDGIIPFGYTTGGDLPWIHESSIGINGTGGIQSGAITHDQTSWIERTYITTTELTNLQFDLRTRTEIDFDPLVLYVDGIEVARYLTSHDYLTQNYILVGIGKHKIRWSYEKDSAVSSVPDYVSLDNVCFFSIA